MGKINVTNHALFALEQEVQSMNNSILQFWFKSKIGEFYNENGVRLRGIHDKRMEIMKKYFVMDEGKLKLEGEDGKQEPVLIEGYTMEDYNKAMEVLMTATNVLSI